MSKNPIIGNVYGSWLVQEGPTKGKKYYCVCLACGKTTKYVKGYDLVNGRTTTCRSCATRLRRETHGMSKSPEYNTWVHMNQRCHNPNNKDYENYGGRGITVYPLWRDSFEAFYMMIGPRPFPEATIERIDYDKGYYPGNVKWIGREEQVLNKRDNIYLEIGGESKTVSQWAEDAPVSSFTIYKRIDRGWLEKYGAYKTVFTPSARESSDSEESIHVAEEDS